MTSQVEIPQEVRRIFGLRAKKILTDHAKSDTDLRTELEEGLIWAFRVGLKARRDKPEPIKESPVMFSSRRALQTPANIDRGASRDMRGTAVFQHSGMPPVRPRKPDPVILEALSAFGFEVYGAHGDRNDEGHVFWRPVPISGGDGYTWVVSRRTERTHYEHSDISGGQLKTCIDNGLFSRAALAGGDGTIIEDEIYIATDMTRAAFLESRGAAAA